MSAENLATAYQTWSVSELRKLPRDKRDAILETAAALAEEEYWTNAELTGFEAFGKDDLHGDSAEAKTR